MFYVLYKTTIFSSCLSNFIGFGKFINFINPLENTATKAFFIISCRQTDLPYFKSNFQKFHLNFLRVHVEESILHVLHNKLNKSILRFSLLYLFDVIFRCNCCNITLICKQLNFFITIFCVFFCGNVFVILNK